jgi:hypothetical protein
MRASSSVRPPAADTTGVPPTWIFQRGEEQLLLRCRENARGVTLVVTGDGDLRSYSFRDFAALVKFEEEMAEFLLATGWSPAQLTIEPQLPTGHVPQPEAQSTSRLGILMHLPWQLLTERSGFFDRWTFLRRP